MRLFLSCATSFSFYSVSSSFSQPPLVFSLCSCSAPWFCDVNRGLCFCVSNGSVSTLPIDTALPCWMCLQSLPTSTTEPDDVDRFTIALPTGVMLSSTPTLPCLGTMVRLAALPTRRCWRLHCVPCWNTELLVQYKLDYTNQRIEPHNVQH